ncbi:soluble lytic murein transglycosylase [Stella humosa]|uniref:Soluble lytic murein transglycosylase n=1 Tax=Stella humosa TaxID=94 RepID=A0A3N1M5A2_9PROT|nr:lytic transglycosylase domain-containing protein [Stella humosa]ROQ00972.1 soluble lytic murein transglycosylase [Stella humosa]
MKLRTRLPAAALAAILLLSSPAGAQGLPVPVAMSWQEAGAAIRAGNWADARRIADAAGQPVARKLVRWLEWNRDEARIDPVEVAAFVEANPSWPGLQRLSRLVEERLDPAPPDATLIAWFDRRRPETTAGRIAYGAALLRSNRLDDANAILRQAWVEGSLRADEEKDFLARFSAAIRPADHADRLDRLIWTNETLGAQRMLALVDPARQRVAEMRLKLRAGRGTDGLARLSDAERAEPELLYELVRHYRRVEDDASAQAILVTRPAEAARAATWWVERNVLSRRALRLGRPADAYALAATHGYTEGAPLAEAEFLAGWIALRFLSDPAKAAAHFARLDAAVNMPISSARAAYWRGRATEAAGDGATAAAFYQEAARYLTTYYGQLAAERIGLTTAPDWVTVATAEPTAAEIAAFNAREPAVAAELLLAIGDARTARTFVSRLVLDAKTPAEHALAASLAQRSGYANLVVLAGKRAGYDGIHLPAAAFPVQSTPVDAETEAALVNAVIRQESMFDPYAVSSAGARGLMQLMPGTARQLAKQMVENHSDQRLTADPAYNVALGSRYLADQIRDFNGSYILAVAGYNAGPARSRQWVQTYGDPRNGGVDPIDWVESIPFNETRNYVQRVMENLQVYRWRLAGPGTPVALSADLRR